VSLWAWVRVYQLVWQVDMLWDFEDVLQHVQLKLVKVRVNGRFQQRDNLVKTLKREEEEEEEKAAVRIEEKQEKDELSRPFESLPLSDLSLAQQRRPAAGPLPGTDTHSPS